MAIADMHRLTTRVLDGINVIKNTNVTINEIFCFSPPPYYVYWFERSYPNIPINQYIGPFCLQCMNGVQGKKPAEQ